MTTMTKPARPPRAEDPRHPITRLTAILDDGSLALLAPDDDTGIAIATGTMHGVDAIAFCTDATIMGGALGADGCAKVVAAYDEALRRDCPIVGIWHSGGARLADGVLSLHGVGEIFAAMTRASGVIAQVSVVLGAAAGGAAYGPALTDVVISAPEGRIFVTGPDVIKSVTGELIDMVTLGGPQTHASRSGVVHCAVASEVAAYDEARALVDLLARHGEVGEVADRDLAAVLPESPKRTYDVWPLVTSVLDDDTAHELHGGWATSVTVALGRLGGRSVGVVASNPKNLVGCLDSASAEKAARFVRMCDGFGLPLVVITDVPGYLPGVNQEWEGIVRRGAKLLHAFAEAVVPRVTLVTRKAYGGAYIAMNSRSLGATRVFAWPDAEVAVMGPLSAVRILHRKALAAVPDNERPALEAELAAEHERKAGGVAKAVQIGVVDEIVAPDETRSRLAAAIRETDTGRRGRHTNIPL